MHLKHTTLLLAFSLSIGLAQSTPVDLNKRSLFSSVLSLAGKAGKSFAETKAGRQLILKNGHRASGIATSVMSRGGKSGAMAAKEVSAKMDKQMAKFALQPLLNKEKKTALTKTRDGFKTAGVGIGIAAAGGVGVAMFAGDDDKNGKQKSRYQQPEDADNQSVYEEENEYPAQKNSGRNGRSRYSEETSHDYDSQTPGRYHRDRPSYGSRRDLERDADLSPMPYGDDYDYESEVSYNSPQYTGGRRYRPRHFSSYDNEY